MLTSYTDRLTNARHSRNTGIDILQLHDNMQLEETNGLAVYPVNIILLAKMNIYAVFARLIVTVNANKVMDKCTHCAIKSHDHDFRLCEHDQVCMYFDNVLQPLQGVDFTK